MRFWKSGVQVVTLALVSGMAVACAGDDTDDAAVASTDSLSAAPVAPAITDAQIAMIAMTVNSADSAGGALAQTKGESADVKALGKRIMTDHTALNARATALATAAGMSPEDNDDSRAMRTDAESQIATLQGLSGKDFDKAYMDHVVSHHQQVLDALDQKLIPNAQNAELKQLLTDARAGVEGHLGSAKAIQMTLNQ